MGATATLGIRALREGVAATKYGRSGKSQKSVVLRLSPDDQVLTWETHGLAKLKKKATKRSIRMIDLVEILFGVESAAMRRTPSSLEHVSASLVLRASLPAPPSASGGPTRLSSSDARDTLDLTIEDEEHFGLFVAAMRALIARHAKNQPEARAVTQRERDALQAEVEQLRRALAEQQSRAEVPLPTEGAKGHERVMSTVPSASLGCTGAPVPDGGAHSAAPGEEEFAAEESEPPNASAKVEPPNASAKEVLEAASAGADALNAPPVTEAAAAPSDVGDVAISDDAVEGAAAADSTSFACGDGAASTAGAVGAADAVAGTQLALRDCTDDDIGAEGVDGSSTSLVVLGASEGRATAELADDVESEEEEDSDDDLSSLALLMSPSASSAAVSQETQEELERRILRLEALLAAGAHPSAAADEEASFPGANAGAGQINPFGEPPTIGPEAEAEHLFSGDAQPARAEDAADALFADGDAHQGAATAASALFGAADDQVDSDPNPFSSASGDGTRSHWPAACRNPFAELAQPACVMNPFEES